MAHSILLRHAYELSTAVHHLGSDGDATFEVREPSEGFLRSKWQAFSPQGRRGTLSAKRIEGEAASWMPPGSGNFPSPLLGLDDSKRGSS